MSALTLIILISASVYALRVSGLLLQDVPVPAFFERALRYVPIALISALAVSSLAGQVSGDPTRLIAAAGGMLMVVYARRMWLGILGGFALYWLVRLLVG